MLTSILLGFKKSRLRHPLADATFFFLLIL